MSSGRNLHTNDGTPAALVREYRAAVIERGQDIQELVGINAGLREKNQRLQSQVDQIWSMIRAADALDAQRSHFESMEDAWAQGSNFGHSQMANTIRNILNGTKP